MARRSDGVPEKMQMRIAGFPGTNLQCILLVRSTRHPCSLAAFARSLMSMLPGSLYAVKDKMTEFPNGVKDFLASTTCGCWSISPAGSPGAHTRKTEFAILFGEPAEGSRHLDQDFLTPHHDEVNAVQVPSGATWSSEPLATGWEFARGEGAGW